MFLSPSDPPEKPLEGLWHGFCILKWGLSCRVWGSGTLGCGVGGAVGTLRLRRVPWPCSPTPRTAWS